MKNLILAAFIIFIISFTLNAQIGGTSFNFDTPVISIDGSLIINEVGPMFVVQIDTSNYELDSNSVYKIDSEWIECISVYKIGEEKKKYGDHVRNGLVIIYPKAEFEDEVLRSIGKSY